MSKVQCKGKLKYWDGLKYEVGEDIWFQTPIVGMHARCPFVRLFADGTLYIEKGFGWDGASGPTIDTKSSMRASLVHDALYRLMSAGELNQSHRAVADKMLKDLCVQDGMWRWRARLWWAAVRRFAGYASHSPRKLKEAP